MVEYFDIGYISNTHALKGEVKVRPYTDDSKRFGKLKKVLVDFNGNLVSYDIEQVRYQQDMVLLKLKTIDSIEQAEKLKNHYIKIPRSEAKSLEDGEYFIADLIGCKVYENELIGVLDDIFTAGAGDVYVIKRKGKKDLLLPALSSVIKNVDIEGRRIDVEIPRGLDDEVWCTYTFSWNVCSSRAKHNWKSWEE